MATFTEAITGLEVDKCYYISGTITNYTAGSTVFRIGDGSTFDTLLTVSANGGFVKRFTYDGTTDYTYFQISTGNMQLNDLMLRLDPACNPVVCSECFKLTDCERCEHMKLSWTNNDDAFGFSFQSPFTQTVYIQGGLRVPDYPYEEEYFTTSERSTFPIYVAARKTQELWIHEIPEYLHDAIRLGVVHDSFYINDVKYVKVEGSYTPDWDVPNTLLAPVIVKVAEAVQNTTNSNCN